MIGYAIGWLIGLLLWPLVVFIILRGIWGFIMFGLSRPGMPGDRRGRP
jgi:hypothetical protein